MGCLDNSFCSELTFAINPLTATAVNFRQLTDSSLISLVHNGKKNSPELMYTAFCEEKKVELAWVWLTKEQRNLR